MQRNDEYIDELFAVKLGNMEATPPEDGWVRIENELNRRVSMKRKIWTAAASLALIFSATASVIYIQNSNTETDNSAAIAVVENILQLPEEETPLIDESPPVIEKEEFPAQPLPTDIATEAKYTYNTANDNNVTETYGISSVSDYVSLPDEMTVEQDAAKHAVIEQIATEPVAAPITANIARNEPEILVVEKTEKFTDFVTLPTYTPDYGFIGKSSKFQPRKRWSFTVQFAPVQSYRTISAVPSGLQRSDFDDAESPLRAYSAGIAVSYRIFNRLSIQTGISYSQTGQSINNVTPVTNMYAAVSSNNSYTKNFVKTSSGSVAITSNLKSDVNTTYSSYFNDEPLENSAAASNSNISSFVKYRLIERVDYLEIPIMLRYTVIDRKLQLYVLGGMSANVLLGTKVFVDNGDELVKNGIIVMARPVNHSSTVGLGIGYKIFNNMSIGFEPLFKYYMHSYTTGSPIKSNPYAFGISTSLMYNF